MIICGMKNIHWLCCDFYTGVLLFLESGRDSVLNDGRILANNSLISSGSLSADYGLACYSADQTANAIGQWVFPNGIRVERETGDQQQLLYAHNQIGQVTLQIRDNRAFPSDLEGVYRCLIPDETETERTLYAGLYSTTSYSNSGEYKMNYGVNLNMVSFPLQLVLL